MLLNSVLNINSGGAVTPPSTPHRYWRVQLCTGYSSIYTTVAEVEFHDWTDTDILSTATITPLGTAAPGSGNASALTDGLSAVESQHYIFDSGRTAFDFDFGSAVSLKKLRWLDRSDNSGIYAKSHSTRAVGVYFSDDDITYTLSHVNFFETTTSSPIWHDLETPDLAGVSIGANDWSGIWMTNTANPYNYTIRTLAFYDSGVEVIGNSAAPTAYNETSIFGAGYETDNTMDGTTSRWNGYNTFFQSAQFLCFEKAATEFDRLDITATEFPAGTPEDFVAMTGDGACFVPVITVTGEVGWTGGETRSFT